MVRIATRKSPLALWQARHVAQRLTALHPGLEVELITLMTQGDRILDAPLAKIGGKGLFVKELENGLLEGRADLAVHSMKDVPAAFPAGLHLPVILEREDPRDALISSRHSGFKALPKRARIGTSSLRRQTQLRQFFPEAELCSLRGNVGTRLEKLEEQGLDAIILAAAGMIRLGLRAQITEILSPEVSLPAVGQGAIGIECREGDARIEALISPLHHADTADCVRAERAFNAALNGGCQVPIAGYAVLSDQELRLRGLVADPDSDWLVKDGLSGPRDQAEELGRQLAARLLKQGAAPVLARILGEA
jgi:hydroxymethylbilane synthase